MRVPQWIVDITELLDLPIEERGAWIRRLYESNPPPLPEPLRQPGGPTERQILQAQAQEHGLGFVDLERVVCDPDAIAAIPRELVTKFQALPVKREKMTIWCAFSEMPSSASVECLKSATRCRILPVLAQESSLAEAIHRHYGD